MWVARRCSCGTLFFQPRIQLQLFLAVGHLTDRNLLGAHSGNVRFDDDPVVEAHLVFLAELRKQLVAEESQLARFEDGSGSKVGDAPWNRGDDATRRS